MGKGELRDKVTEQHCEKEYVEGLKNKVAEWDEIRGVEQMWK